MSLVEQSDQLKKVILIRIIQTAYNGRKNKLQTMNGKEIGKAEGHKLSRSATSASDLNQHEVHDVVLNCDRRHLGAALSAIINRLHDEVDEAQ